MVWLGPRLTNQSPAFSRGGVKFHTRHNGPTSGPITARLQRSKCENIIHNLELTFHAMGGGHPKLIDFYTDNKLFLHETDNCVVFIGICDSGPGDGNVGTWGGQETSGGPGTGGHKVASVWWLKCDYYEIQVKCCIHCLIVCLAHFDNSHNEQQSEHKIQVLTTNQSDSCSHKKKPKNSNIKEIISIQIL